MKKRMLLATGTAVVLTTSGLAAGQTTTVQFEPQPCVLTLSPSYTASVLGDVAAEVPTSALACPGFTFDLASDTVTDAYLTNAQNQDGPQFSQTSLSYFDAATNALMSRNVLRLAGSVWGPVPATYDRFRANSTAPYVTRTGVNGAPDTYYRITLAAPVTFFAGTPTAPICKVALKKKYAWRWNQANYWVVPDSAIQCTGVTFSSATMSAYLTLQSRQTNQGYLSTSITRTYDPATGQVSLKRELRLSNTPVTTYDQLIQLQLGMFGRGGQAPVSREHGFVAPASASQADQRIWGRFSVQMTGDFLPPIIVEETYLPPASVISQSQQYVRFTSTGPFTIKRVTDVTLKSRRLADGRLRLSITADRNASFQNASGPTYRRQTVLPATPADHAVLRRGNTVLKKVKLSNYGTATVTVQDVPGRNRYSVTMVETDDNYQGRAQVRR